MVRLLQEGLETAGYIGLIVGPALLILALAYLTRKEETMTEEMEYDVRQMLTEENKELQQKIQAALTALKSAKDLQAITYEQIIDVTIYILESK